MPAGNVSVSATFVAGATPLDAPDNVTISAIDADGFTASWDEVAEADGYYWTLSTSSTYAGITPANTLAEDAIVGSSTHSVTESVVLSAGTTYYFYVVAVGDGITTDDSEPASTSGSFLADKTYTITWNSTNNSKGISGYGNSWSVTASGITCNMTNWNNNNNGWDYVKCGHKTTAYTATIITAAAIPEAIKTVKLTIGAVSTQVTSAKLFVSDSSAFGDTPAGTFTLETGEQSVVIGSPAANKYYKIEVVCTTGSSNGPFQLNQLVFTTK